jgi:hypothetical protein
MIVPAWPSHHAADDGLDPMEDTDEVRGDLALVVTGRNLVEGPTIGHPRTVDKTSDTAERILRLADSVSEGIKFGDIETGIVHLSAIEILQWLHVPSDAEQRVTVPRERQGRSPANP